MISTSIVEAHGGQLWASLVGPQGGAFSFSLPVAVEAATADRRSVSVVRLGKVQP